jgi:hypothetical protein
MSKLKIWVITLSFLVLIAVAYHIARPYIIDLAEKNLEKDTEIVAELVSQWLKAQQQIPDWVNTQLQVHDGIEANILVLDDLQDYIYAQMGGSSPWSFDYKAGKVEGFQTDNGIFNLFAIDANPDKIYLHGFKGNRLLRYLFMTHVTFTDILSDDISIQSVVTRLN